jgi:hypothetical protein
VKAKKESTEVSKNISYRHITNGYPQKNEASNITGEFYFVLETLERKFILSTATEQERQLWVAAIHFIVVTTKLVQNLMSGSTN